VSFTAWGEHFAIDLPGARAVFTTRRGGTSAPPYESLNLGLPTDDAPDAVAANLRLLARATRVELAYGRQVHGAEVLRMSAGNPPGTEPPEADGVATAAHGVGALVLTADCLAIAIAGGGSVAMVHAGWHGLACGVIAAGVAAVRDLGSGGPLAAAIGPGAGPCCYEVGGELHQRFAAYGPNVRRGANLDLKLIARLQLEAAGVADVADTGLCTICSSPDLFFSHRRDRGITGRQAGVAWLT
jgi:YfiH family protein